MKQAIAILETEIATRQAAIKDELQAIEDLEYIVIDLHRLSGTETAPEPKQEPAKQPEPKPEAPPVPEPKKEAKAPPLKKPAPKIKVKRDRNAHTESAISTNGKNYIPADLEILAALQNLKETTTTDLKNELNKHSKLPILPQVVLNGLERLRKKSLVRKDLNTTPQMWIIRVDESLNETTIKRTKKILPKSKEGNFSKKSSYNDKLKFAESKGYKNLAEAIGAMGANTFNQEFKNRDNFASRL